jgi:putative ABC transport system permease protein
MREPPRSLKLYRWLLRLYPATFREEYAVPMERAFRDELAESHNVWALAVLWLRLLSDLAKSIPLQLMREVRQDTRHTLRLWVKSPGNTAFAILALAIGIGANTGVFSVVDALVLRSLPFQDPSRLASLHTYLVPHDSAREFHDWLRQSAYLADAALFEQTNANLGNTANTVRTHVAQTSWNFFSILGAHPVIGRAFNGDEDTPGRNAVAVIGYGLWQQLFAGDTRVLGSRLRVNGMPLTVIGVMSPGFDYPNHTVLWKAGEFSPGNNRWETIARLKPGVTWPQARAAFAAEMDRSSPNRNMTRKYPPQMIPLQDQLTGPVKNASLLLMAGVALILLIACSNVANLLLARTADRAQELSIRSSLGASRARLAQQLFTECLLLSSLASIAGLVVAFWTVAQAAKVQPSPLATQSYSILDGRVLGFAVLTAMLSALFFGLLPSWNAGRAHAFMARGSSGTRHTRVTRDILVAAQVTLTIVLLTASVSVGRAFVNLMRIDRGFGVKGLVTVSVSLDGTTRQLAGRQLPYFEEALNRIRHVPGVRNASETEFLPLNSPAFLGGPHGLDGRPAKENSMIVLVLDGYFQTVGGHMLFGREFTEAEVRSDTKVAVVSESFASQFGEPRNAIGHEVTQGSSPPLRIIGVVRGLDYMTEEANSTQIFVPAHSPGGFFSTFVVRVNGQAQDHLAAIRDAMRSVDTQVPVFDAKTMEQRMDDALARPKFYRTALLFFAGFALLLAVIGMYGVVSYAVAQRTREMGVRLALGTTPRRLRTMLLWQGLLSVAVGAAIGVTGATLTGRFLESLVSGAKPFDLATFTFSTLLLFFTAATSIWAATRRIAGLDIMDILRFE